MRKIRILFVEDNESLYQLFNEYLIEKQEPMEIIGYCRNGVECLNKVNEISPNGYDFILLDLQMPELSGFLTILKLIEQYGHEITNNIIVCSSYINEYTNGLLVQAGIKLPPILKPYLIENVIRVIIFYSKDLLNEDGNANVDINRRINQNLLEQGIDFNSKMGGYISDFLYIVISDSLDVEKYGIMSKIYKQVSMKHNVNKNTIEVAILKELHKIGYTKTFKEFVKEFLARFLG